jgi:hypothetical protein
LFIYYRDFCHFKWKKFTYISINEIDKKSGTSQLGAEWSKGLINEILE